MRRKGGVMGMEVLGLTTPFDKLRARHCEQGEAIQEPAVAPELKPSGLPRPSGPRRDVGRVRGDRGEVSALSTGSGQVIASGAK